MMKNTPSLAIILGLFLAFSAGARGDAPISATLQQVLAQHRLALGGTEALAISDKAERTTGQYEIGGLHGPYVSITQGINKTWSNTKFGIYDETAGSDGKIFWQRDTNGNIRLLSLDEVKLERLNQYLNTFSYLFPDRLPGKVTLQAQTEPRTGDYVLDVMPDDGSTATLYLNAKTFLADKETYEDDTHTTTVTFGQYKKLGGVMTPTDIRKHSYDKRSDDRTTVSTVEDAPSVDSLFTLPQNTKNYEWLQAGATSADVSIDTSDHRLNLYVGLNGEPAYIILDSGSGGFVLDLRAASMLNLKHQGKLGVSGYGGYIDSFPFMLDTLNFSGEIAFRNLAGLAINIPPENAIYPVIVPAGYLGYELLSRFVTRIDAADATLRLSDPAAWKPTSSDGTPLPMELYDNVPSIIAQIDGLPPARFLIDTGDTNTLELYAPYVLQNKLLEKYPKAIESGGAGVGGNYKAKETRVQSLTINGIKLTGVPANLSLDSKGGDSKILAGAIGMQVLERFAVTFDYANRRMFFQPNPDATKAFDTRSFGTEVITLPDAYVKNKTNYWIAYVDSASPGFHNGLTAGMQLLKVDGKPVADLGLAEVRRLLSPESGSKTHELAVIGPAGGTGTFKVALFDPLETK